MQLVQGWNLTYKQYEGAQDENQSANVGWHTSFLDRPPFCHDCRMQCTLQTPVSMSKSPTNHQNLLKFLCEWLLWKAEEPNTVYHIVFTNILTFFSSSLLSSHIYGSYDSTNLIFTSLSSDQNSILSLCTDLLAFSDADFFFYYYRTTI